VAVNPFNSDEWIIIGDDGTGVTRTGTALLSGGQSVMWRTTDAGATWAAVPVGDVADAGVISYDSFYGPLTSIGYLSDGTIFYAGNIGTGSSTGVVAWRGTAAGLSGTTLIAPGGSGFYGAVAGQGGDLVMSYRPGPFRRGYLASGASAITEVDDGIGLARITRLDTTSRAIAFGHGLTWRAHADYRAASAGVASSVGGDGTAAAGYGYLVNGGRGSDIYRVDDPLGTPTNTLIVSTGATGAAAADVTQSTIAVIEGGTTPAASATIHYTEDGAAWQSFAGPTGGGLNTYALAVIVRT
jgi:hypothetical protein